MPSLVTWNMYGANAASDQKWETGVKNMATSLNVDVLCLQECGGSPPSSQPLQINLAGSPEFTLLGWGGTSKRPSRYVSYYFWDVAGNRVNLAIVTSTQPTGYVCSLPNGAQWRPFIGVLVNNVYYFCIHAISPGGPDAPALLMDADNAAVNPAIVGNPLAAPFLPWYAAGDFNRDPQAFPNGNWTLCPPVGRTYPTLNPVSTYDYMFTSGNQAINGAIVNGVYSSDHLPVLYRF